MTVLVGTPHAVVPLHCTGPESPSAELYDASGVKARARVHCFYGDTAYLDFGLDARGQAVAPDDPAYPVIVAGDVIALRSGPTAITATVPSLEGDVSSDGTRAFGRLPAGIAATLDVFRGTLEAVLALWPYDDPEFRWWSRHRSPAARLPIRADATGAWSLDLGAKDVLRPGDSALVAHRDAEGHRYIVGIAPPAIVVGLHFGRPLVLVQATSGARVAVEVVLPGKAPLRVERRASLWGWTPPAIPWADDSAAYLPGTMDEWITFGAREPLPAGTRITLARQDGADGGLAPSEHRMVTGAHDVDIDAIDHRAIRGRAGPSRVVAVRVAGPLEFQHRASAIADARGVFTASLPVPLDAGWRVLVVEEVGPIAAGSFLGRRHAHVAVGSPFVVGTSESGDEAITVTLRAGDGRVLAMDDRVWIRDDSTWESVVTAPVAEGRGLPVAIQPGMVVEVAFDAGDAVTIPIPDVTASVQQDGSALHGTAPPGALVRVAGGDGTPGGQVWPGSGPRHGGLAVRAGAVVTAGLDGAWSASAAELGLDRPLVAGDFGAATVNVAGGHAVAVGWAPIALEYDLDTGDVEGVGPPWSRPGVTVLDADGRPVAGRREHPELDLWSWSAGWSPGTAWSAALVDALGAPVLPFPGDALRVAFRNQIAVVPIPPLGGVIHAEDGLVVGRAGAGQAVACSLTEDDRPVTGLLTTTADAAGLWQLDVRDGGLTALTARHGAACRVDVPPHRFRRAFAAPGLAIDLDQGLVDGRVTAGAAVTVTRERGGSAETLAGRADPEGGFRLAVPGGAAQPPEAPIHLLGPGDVVTVTVPDPRGGVVAQAVAIPPLELSLDTAAGQIVVAAPPSSTVVLSLGSAESHGTYFGPEGARLVPEDGRLVVDAGPLGGLGAGRSVAATLWLPSGHRVSRRRLVPQLAIPIGGQRVCVLGVPGVRAAVELLRGGRVVAGGAAQITPTGAAAIDLVGEGNLPELARSGDVVRASLGGGPVIGSGAVEASLTVPPLVWAMDWDDEVVAGRTLPGAALEVAFSSRRGCDPAPVDAWLPGGSSTTKADADGGFRWQHDGSVAMGLFALADTELQLRLDLDDPEGHVAVARGRALRADAHVGTAWLSGEADSGVEVAAEVRGADGVQRAAGTARTGPDGRWRMALGIESGGDLRPGDRVELAAGAQESWLTVQPLGFDVGGDGDVWGTAAPGAAVALSASIDPRLGWRASERALVVFADDRGAWVLPAAAGRRGWSLADVVSLTASVAAEGRHRTIVAWHPTTDRPEGDERLVLPWLGRR